MRRSTLSDVERVNQKNREARRVAYEKWRKGCHLRADVDRFEVWCAAWESGQHVALDEVNKTLHYHQKKMDDSVTIKGEKMPRAWQCVKCTRYTIVRGCGRCGHTELLPINAALADTWLRETLE